MDTIDRKTRSRVMAAVHSRGNRSTERKLRSALMHAKIRGWRMQASDLLGVPDFVFDKERVVIFVDGCFWHGCPNCYRRPSSSRKYWDAKVNKNMMRDKKIRAKLRREGWSVIGIWEHTLDNPQKAISLIQRKLHENRIDNQMPHRQE